MNLKLKCRNKSYRYLNLIPAALSVSYNQSSASIALLDF